MSAKTEKFVKGPSAASLRSRIGNEYVSRQVEGAVCFKSKIRGLVYTLYAEHKDKDGTTKYRHIPLQFANYSYWTDNENVIEALKGSPSYGGSLDEGFKDVPEEAEGEPLFWLGGYPEWYINSEEDRRRGLEPASGIIEPEGSSMR